MWNIYTGERFVCGVRLEDNKLRAIGNRLSQDTWRRIKALVETDLGLRPPARHQGQDTKEGPKADQ
jgi:hypothetical protein